MKRSCTRLLAILAAAAACGVAAATAAAKGPGTMISPAGVALDGSPFRYVTLSPGYPDKLTVVARIDRRGGKIRRWWYLPGGYYIAGTAYDHSAGGLSADGRTLVLVNHTPQPHSAPLGTKLAILRTDRPVRVPAGEPQPGFVRFAQLRGEWAILALSADGSTLFLSRHPRFESSRVPVFDARNDDFEVRALDTGRGRLLPSPIRDFDGNLNRLDGQPIAQATRRDGRWVYTLYLGARGDAFVYALDTVHGHGQRIDLPQLRGLREPFLLRLHLADSAAELRIGQRSARQSSHAIRPLLTLDTATFAVHRTPPQAVASTGSIVFDAWRLISEVVTSRLSAGDNPRRQSRTAAVLAAFTPPDRPLGYATLRRQVVGRSAGDRPIRLVQRGDASIEGRVLVFGCVHGDECAGSGIQPLSNGCPDPDSNIFVVPNLDPDGTALGSRLNGRGVDLNRNFPASWRSLGERGDPEYSGPRPFSEPETRLAARIVGALDPQATVWFHQHHGAGAYVRAWGQSAPAGRQFARLAGIHFRLMPWLRGTAPNWQNHNFPGTSSFVVELPAGELSPGLEARLAKAIVRLGQKVGED